MYNHIKIMSQRKKCKIIAKLKKCSSVTGMNRNCQKMLMIMLSTLKTDCLPTLFYMCKFCHFSFDSPTLQLMYKALLDYLSSVCY